MHSSRHLSALGCYICILILCPSVFALGSTGFIAPPASTNITTMPVLVGGSVILPCQAPVTGGRPAHVSWHRPQDGLQISRDSEVGKAMRGRVRIMGDRSKGEYHLRLKYAKFPDDNGTWWCNVFNGPRLPVTLTVLVPPATPTPQVTPISGIIFQVSSEAWTFTCVAHYAHPPVTLTWKKITGPPAEYSVLPPSVVMAPDFTMSSSANLMLSPLNHGSVFSCKAQHPTFEGKTHSAEVQFVIADPVVVAKGGKLGLFQDYQDNPDTKEERYQSWLQPDKGLQPPELPSVMATFTPGDVAMVTAAILLLLGALIITGVLWKTRERWELDVKDRSDYTSVPTKEIEYHSNSTFFKRKGNNDREKGGRRHCIQKLTAGGVLLGIVITVLAFIIPVYIKSFAVPVTGVDELVPVLAGSLLWLDCSSVAKTSDNLLEVAWRKNFMKFYNQYSVKQLPTPLGISVNYTQEGQHIGPRTFAQEMGQISIWPVTPSDQGLYICEVARMLDDTGRTSFERKTFAVVVLEGQQVSQALFVLTVIGLVAALALLGLGLYHSLKSQGKIGTKRQLQKEDAI